VASPNLAATKPLMKKQLTWNGAPLSDEDIPEIAQKHKLEYNLVVDVVETMREKGLPLYAKYMGGMRDKVKALVEDITKEPEMQEEPIEQEETITTVEQKPAEETAEEVTDYAAISLIQAVANTNDGCFIVTDDGVCTINPENPPEITHAYQVVGNVLQLREIAPAIEDKSAWMLGSIVDSLEDYFSDEFSISQVCDIESQAYNTIYQKVSVYKAFKKKRYNLPYSTHQEVHFAKIPDNSKHLILGKCETYGLAAKQARALCSIVKKMDDDQTIANIRSKEQAEDLIKTYNEAKVTYLIYDDGQWSRKNGLAGEIPEGKVVIDLKNWQAHAGGETTDIVKSK
jgi:hypothetical protein